MAPKQQCRFFLLRYVPDAVKNEFVNVGLVLLPDAGAAAFVGCEAPAPPLWSVAACCADAVETPAATMIKAVRTVRIFTNVSEGEEKGASRAPRFYLSRY